MLTLKLNADYTPMDIIPWQDAVSLWYLNKVEMVESYAGVTLKSPSISVPCPAVVRLKTYTKEKSRVPYSRMNVLIRDQFQCQYCARALTLGQLTIDHVIPKSKGGQKTWQNSVSSCYPCNSKKADRTPEEAGMTLRSKPYMPKFSVSTKIKKVVRNRPDVWENYLC